MGKVQENEVIFVKKSVRVFALCAAIVGGMAAVEAVAAVPVVQVTDLFRPYADPDDHWDLACQFALARHGAIDLRGVVIDFPPPNVGAGQPDIAGVAQLNWITGLAVPVGVGQPKKGVEARSGLALLKNVLETAKEPVVLHVVGTCGDIAEAAERWPELFKSKVRAVYLDAGRALETGEHEYNVALDPLPYAKMFRLPCPVYWMPCFHEATCKLGRYGTYWIFRQGRLFDGMKPALLNYFTGVLAKRPPTDWLSALEAPVDPKLVAECGALDRNMWCTAGFLHTAGLTVWSDGTIARLGEKPEKEVFRFVPVEVTCDDKGFTKWTLSSAAGNRFLFEVTDERNYQEAMTRALREMMSWL